VLTSSRKAAFLTFCFVKVAIVRMPTYTLAIFSKASGVPAVFKAPSPVANTSINTTMAPIELFHPSRSVPLQSVTC
jgi:hypothetical protein